MSKTYNFVADKIEVRSSLVDSSNPKYIVKGYALVPNKRDTYRYDHSKDGRIKPFRSMFTDNCIKSIKKQAKFKKVFVDSMHEMGINANIKSMVKDKLSKEEFGKVDTWLKSKTLPFAKIDNIDIDDKGLFVETSLNPAFRNVDESHKNYFDAVWSSLQNHYINGISVNIIPTDVTGKEDDQRINNAELWGISFVDQPAIPDTNITEIAMRAAMEFRMGEEKMAEEEIKKKEEEVKQEKEKVEAEKKTLEEEKAKIAKEKEDAEKSDLEKQKEEQKKTQEDLDNKMEDLKKREEALKDKGADAKGGNAAKTGEGSVVKPQDKYGQEAQAKAKEGKLDEKFFKDKVSEITKEHDESVKAGNSAFVDNRMKGFGEMVNLAAKSKDPTLGLDDANKRYIEDNPALLGKSNADMRVPR